MLSVLGTACGSGYLQVSAADYQAWVTNKAAFRAVFERRAGRTDATQTRARRETAARQSAARLSADRLTYCYEPNRKIMYAVRGECSPDELALSKAEFESGVVADRARREKTARQSAARLAADRLSYCYEPNRKVMYAVRGECSSGELALSKAEFDDGVVADRASREEAVRVAAQERERRDEQERQQAEVARGAAEAEDARRYAALLEGQARRADESRKAAEAEAERRRVAEERGRAEQEAERLRIAGLTSGLAPADVVTALVNDRVVLRALPERGADSVGEIARGRQVHVTGVLPSGWLQISEEGAPVGWIFKTAVAPEALSGGAPRPAAQQAAAVAAEPEIVPLDAAYRVRAAANVRAAPDVSADRVASLAAGDRVTALGKVADKDWFLVERDGERLGFVFGPLLQPVGAARKNPDAVAVIIGNKGYTGDTPEVDYAYNDAEAMKRYVVETLGYLEDNIIDLRDASLADLQKAFGTAATERGQLFNRLRPGRSDVTVFYSGHGVPGLNDKRGYLLPVDGDPSLAEITGYSLDVLQANLAKLPARSVQVFLDACFSGNSAAGMLIQATSGIGISPALPDAPANFVMLTAASGDQVASWDREAEHGLFTKNLLDALNGRADERGWGNSDGRVTLAEVKAFLDDEMTFAARRTFNREQNATMVGAGDRVLANLAN